MIKKDRHQSQSMKSCVGFSCMVVILWLVLSFDQAIALDFIQNSSCGLTNPAFTETFSVAHPGGKGGDVDETVWDVSRITLTYDNAQNIGCMDQLDIPTCKQGTPALMLPEQEIMICDNTVPGLNGRLMVPASTPFYYMTGLRSIKPFDFADRTGTIAFDVDGVSTLITGHWADVMLVEDPVPTPNQNIEHAGTPRNGIICCIFGCGADKSSFLVYRYDNHKENLIVEARSDCFSVSEGKLNHIEVKVSKSNLEIWASDFSTDGVTYPNFRKIAQCDTLNLPFDRGYVTFGTHNHATEKYFGYRTAVHYWDNLGFDGPTVPEERFYPVPSSLTLRDATHINLGYALKGDAQAGVYTCCSAGGGLTGPIQPFVLKNVDLTNAQSACITLNGIYFYITNYQTVGIRYRLNGGTWRDNLLTAGEITVLSGTYGASEAGLKQIFPVALSDLQQGDNTLEFNSINAPDPNNIKIANIGLTIKTDRATKITGKISSIPQNGSLISMRNSSDGKIQMYVQSSVQSPIQADIFDASGKCVQRLAEYGQYRSGTRMLIWNYKDRSGQAISNGVFLAKVRVGEKVLTKVIPTLR